MFQTKVAEKIKTHILSSIIFSPQKIVQFLWGNNGTARQATDDNMAQAYCMLHI
jgi:hypothetical protein